MGLVEIGQHRMGTRTGAIVHRCGLLSACALTSVASISITIRSGRPPRTDVRSRAAACAARIASSSDGSPVILSISRNAVESDAIGPNNGS